MTVEFPLLIFVISFFGLWLSVTLGAVIRVRQGPLEKDERNDFNVIQGATLTLLGLIVGFSFSMALSRYDQRRNYEQVEADAISTEYLRVDLLSDSRATATVREVLKRFIDQRIRFYESTDKTQLVEINRDTAQLQKELWSAVRAEAAKQPTPVTALVVSGMNDVLSVQGNTQAAWWNRVPFGDWGMMGMIAVLAGAIIGNGTRNKRTVRLPIFPLVIAVAFFFIADLESPYGGFFIRVSPKDLVSLSQSLK